MMKEKDKFWFNLIESEYPRKDNTYEIWYETEVKTGIYTKFIVRPFRVQKVLNENLHLN